MRWCCKRIQYDMASASDEKRDRLLRKLRGELGVVVVAALEDPSVVEILLNPDGRIWAERLGEGMKAIGEMSTPNAASLLGTVAASLDTAVTRDRPIVEGELLLDGSRFEGMLPPVVSGPTFAIRKRASAVIPLAQYVADGEMAAWQAEVIEDAVAARRNILVVGGTGSGKTTLVNGILDEVARRQPGERLAIIEDTAEIQTSAANVVAMRTSLEVGMVELLKATMRLRPDRIIVGEVRGAEALTLLKAWNTGHPGGVGTVHASGAAEALTRLEHLVGEAGVIAGVRPLIGQAVDLVVAMERTAKGRRLSELLDVIDFKGGEYVTRRIDERRCANGPF